MITLTRLDGKSVCVNESNILWIEALPDTCIMLLGGGRILVKQTVQEVKELVEGLVKSRIREARNEAQSEDLEMG